MATPAITPELTLVIARPDTSGVFYWLTDAYADWVSSR
jgi:hypothetical protein